MFKKEQRPEDRISDELAAYGYYARSMKPKKGWLSQSMYKLRPICRVLTPGLLRQCYQPTQHPHKHFRNVMHETPPCFPSKSYF